MGRLRIIVYFLYVIFPLALTVLADDPKVQIDLTDPPLDPVEGIIIQQKDKDVQLTCDVENKPVNSSVQWTVEPKDSSDVVIISTATRSLDAFRWAIDTPTTTAWRLRIQNAQVADEGRYTCQVQVSTQVYEKSSRVLKIVQTPQISDLYTSSDMTKKTGEEARFDCFATGRPKPIVKWVRLAGELLPNGGTEFQGNEFEIESVKLSDAGVYKCIALNSAGSVERKVRLTVKLSLGQMLSFPNGIKSQSQDGRRTGNWTADGKLTITKMDGVVFEPKVDVQLVTALCSIDLRSCVSEKNLPMTSEVPCYCIKDSEENYSLHVTGHDDASQDYVTVQAITPSRFVFSPIALAAHVGTLPSTDDTRIGESHKTPSTPDGKRPSHKVLTYENFYCGKPDTCSDVDSSSPQQVATLSSGLEVMCDTETDNGGWIVIQRRRTQDANFDNLWEEYKYGFGDLLGDFWFGLERVHRLTFQGRYELRVDLVIEGKSQFAHYKHFTLYGEQENYKIRVSGFSGNATDDLSSQDKAQFSTIDKYQDQTTKACANRFKAGWWFTGCFGNSHQRSGYSWWATTVYFGGMNISFTEMKIRPLQS